ncbi:hypothetical protein N7462_004014 [Penicillium macrosclerotiorum]|uniref:uncharacterized protein n=1 Tax=Penicillium macrosclerotiorum TaxID=303699 RepID=UPI0025473F7E|nr:uncharacterized protein N7462_004014 [Penicillium macrosclerotiorum]KAJ5689622.1 hypothetical protein N7462_004014 [Penicillium macrosclerotiorum]
MSSFLSSKSSKSSSKSMSSDAASTHSTVSTATTLRGTELSKNKWFSLLSEPKHVTKSDAFYAKQATHNEAVASYFSLR